MPSYTDSGKDVLLYRTSGNFVDKGSEVMDSSILSSRVSERLETIANKVTKYLLTTKGSDPHEPDYGSYLSSIRMASEELLPKIIVDINSFIVECEDYIKDKERYLPYDSEKLSSLRLIDVVYDRNTPDALHIYIQIVTTKNNNSILDLQTSYKG